MSPNHTTLSGVVLQEAVDLPERSIGSFWLGLGVVAILTAVAFFILYRTNYAGLADGYDAHKQALEGAKLAETPRTVKIRVDDHIQGYRDVLLEKFDATPTRRVDDDAPSSVAAVRHAYGELASAWQPVHDRFPTPAVRAFELAALLAVFGAVAVSSNRLVTWLLEGGPTTRGVGDTFGTATSLLVDVLTAAVTSIPFVGALWAYTFSLSITLANLAYEFWYFSAALVALTGVVLVVLDVLASDDTDLDVVLLDRRTIAVGVVKWLPAIYAAAVTPVVLLSAAGAGQLGAVIGLVLGALVALWAWVRAVKTVLRAAYAAAGIDRGLTGRVTAFLDAHAPDVVDSNLDTGDPDAAAEWVREEAEYDPIQAAHNLESKLTTTGDWPPDPDEFGDDTPTPSLGERVETAASALVLLAARATSVVLGLGTLLLVVYASIAVALDGSLWTVAAATLRAPLHRQVLVAAIVGTPLLVAAVQMRAAWPTVRSAVADIWTRQRVRTALLRRGAPTVVAVVAFPLIRLVFVSGLPFPYADLVAAVAAGAVAVLTRLLISALYRARYRVAMRDRATDRPHAAVCHVYELDDADGRAKPHIEINGQVSLLHDSRERLVDDALEVADAITDGDDRPATISEAYAEAAFTHGIADGDEEFQKLWERARKRVMHALRDADRVMQRSEFHDDVDDLPEEVVEARCEDLRKRGFIRFDDDYVYLNHDPWAT